MGFKNKLTNLVVDSWQPIIFAIFGLALLSGLMFFKLGNLVPSLSLQERSYQASTQTVDQIINNPVNAPHKLLTFGVSQVNNSDFFLRGVSSLLAIITVIFFFLIVSKWYGRLESTIITILFASSSWLLHYARFATADILLTGVITAIVYGLWLKDTKRSALAIFLGVFIFGVLAYVPGMIGFLIIGMIWQRKHIFGHIKRAGFILLPSVILLTIIVIPIVNALIRTPDLWRDFLGLPQHWPSVYEYFKAVANVPVQIFVRGSFNPALWLARLPLIDVFCSAMFIIGTYTYFKKIKLDRSKILFGLIIFGGLLVGFQAGVSIILLIVPLYFVIGAGIAYMLNQWLKVFPSNPLARGIGIGLICLVAALSGYYNLKQYFVAWPNSPATKQVFKQR